mgnify:CR=1 FL=1
MADSNQKTFLTQFQLLLSNQYFPLVILVLLIAVFWEMWRWYFVRVLSSTDGYYGILALISVLLISVWQGKLYPQNYLILAIAALTTFLFAITYNFLPPLLQGTMAFTALSCVISLYRFGKIFHFGIWSLFVLSLPSIASLQFFFGFPMRILVAEATTLLLKLNGLAVIKDGVGLIYGKQTIWIDAPCSGVKMLWAGFFLTALLVTLWRFSLAKSILAFFLSFCIIIIGNIFRATGLFYLEAEIVKMPAFAHEAVGVICFIFTCISIVLALQKLNPNTTTVEKKYSQTPSLKLSVIFSICFVCSIFSAIYVQVGVTKKYQPVVQTNSVKFPTEFENKPIQELGLTEIEVYFMQDFPGIVKRFTDGERELIIRYVSEATRKLHSPADCFAGNGYQITPLPLKIDNENNRWGCFLAKKNGDNLKVCERIYNNSGENWTDVSSWYWSALSGVNTEGYWAITTAETALE